MTIFTSHYYLLVIYSPLKYKSRVDPGSKALEERTYFDRNFGPFWRAQQVIFTAAGGGSVVSRDSIRQLFLVMEAVAGLRAKYVDSAGNTSTG